MKKLLNILGAGIFFSIANIFGSSAQTKPRIIVNPFTHPNNSEWNYSNQKDSLLENAFKEDSI